MAGCDRRLDAGQHRAEVTTPNLQIVNRGLGSTGRFDLINFQEQRPPRDGAVAHGLEELLSFAVVALELGDALSRDEAVDVRSGYRMR